MTALRIHDVYARLTPPSLQIHDTQAHFVVAVTPQMRVMDVQVQFVAQTAPQIRIFDVFAKFGTSPVRHIYTDIGSGLAWYQARRHVWSSGAWVEIDPL